MTPRIKAVLDSLRGRGIKNIGLPWYEASDYQQAKALMEDGDSFSVTYGEWELQAKELEQALCGEGYTVVRAHIRSIDFAQWCRSNGHHVNSQGRNAFANWAAMNGNSQIH